MTATFTQTGGARLGMLNATYPFATLSATPDALRLSCLGRDCCFRKDSIRRLTRHRGVLSTGLRIEHTDSSFPDFVVFWASPFFWTAGFQKLKTELESIGYEIHD